jgi:hypothetical protein
VKTEKLTGMTFSSVKREKLHGYDELVFTSGGDEYVFSHVPDCCELVEIHNICGDLDDLVGTPLLHAECSTNHNQPPEGKFADESWTWTFYRFDTIMGSVVVRWFGTSSGYYSEEVDLFKRAQGE